MAEERPIALPGHTVLSRLGRGGMASVWLAREDALSRLVAVKVIDQRFDDDRQLRARFEREARTAASLSHPSIVPVYQYGLLEDGRPFMTMAFLDGGSLRDRLQRSGPCPVEEALAITRRVAGALQAAHARNVIHRDLKPDNVMFQGENALLMDFGIAKVMDASTHLTGSGINPGTVRYFSPEQALGRPLDQRSDLYALGVMLYEMLTGRLPLEADAAASWLYSIAFEAPAPLPPALGGLQPLLDLLLAKDPVDRLGSSGEMLAVVGAMERNWHRFESVDRLLDGVVLRPSGGSAPLINLDDLPPPNVSTDLDVGLLLQSLQRTQTVPPSSDLRSGQESRTGLFELSLTPPGARALLEFTDQAGAVRREVWAGRALELPVGAVRVLAVAEGYQDLQRTVLISPGRNHEILSLSPASAAGNTAVATADGARAGEPAAGPGRAGSPAPGAGARAGDRWQRALLIGLPLVAAGAVYVLTADAPGGSPGPSPAGAMSAPAVDPALKKALAAQFASLQAAREGFEHALQALGQLAAAERVSDAPERPRLDAQGADAQRLAEAGEFEAATQRYAQAREAALAAQLALVDRALAAATAATEDALKAKDAAAARKALAEAERLAARRAELAAANRRASE